LSPCPKRGQSPSRKGGNVTFKAYTMEQPRLLPPDLGELIPEDRLVRVVNRVVDAIDLEPLLRKYKGEGRAATIRG